VCDFCAGKKLHAAFLLDVYCAFNLPFYLGTSTSLFMKGFT
jgi:hypothetical protein